MEPRLPSSKKWTPFPKELLSNIEEVFTKNFKKASQKGIFKAQGRIYSQEILFRIGYKKNDEIRYANFEVSIEYNPKKENALKLIYTAIDCTASLMDQFFEEEDFHAFPKNWQSFNVGKKEVFIQTHSENPELEAEADKLLGIERSDNLVQEEKSPLDELLEEKDSETSSKK
ncbi:MAG: hypothetical protein D6797_09155 [Bdellovibrio sp.]|nr:MAG: hypothetical protein D6797_09155 [Bdellovibrio sp.]